MKRPRRNEKWVEFNKKKKHENMKRQKSVLAERRRQDKAKEWRKSRNEQH